MSSTIINDNNTENKDEKSTLNSNIPSYVVEGDITKKESIIQVIVDSLNVRSEPDSDSDIITIADKVTCFL